MPVGGMRSGAFVVGKVHADILRLCGVQTVDFLVRPDLAHKPTVGIDTHSEAVSLGGGGRWVLAGVGIHHVANAPPIDVAARASRTPGGGDRPRQATADGCVAGCVEIARRTDVARPLTIRWVLRGSNMKD
eukprot:2476398-Rhodomonas_salina.5